MKESGIYFPAVLSKSEFLCFLLAGMYHMFLLIKDGFFHITNLALAKIETGIKILCAVDLKFYWSHFFDQIKHSFFFRQTSH